jgi:hypothetical protein
MKTQKLLSTFSSGIQGFITLVTVLGILHLIQASTQGILQNIAMSKQRALSREKQDSPPQERSKTARILRSDKRFQADGTVHYVYTVPSPRNHEEEEKLIQIYDVNDNLIWSGRSKPIPYTYLSWASSHMWRHYYRFEGLSQGVIERIHGMSPEFSQTLDISVNRDTQAQAVWRYDPGRQHFAGYTADGNRIGYLGANGLAPTRVACKPLEEPINGVAWCPPRTDHCMMLWMTDSRLLQIDFAKQAVSCLMESPQSPLAKLSVQGWFDLNPKEPLYADPNAHPPLLCCANETGTHYFVFKDSKQVVTFNPPADWDEKVGTHYQFSSTPQGLFLCRDYIDFNAPPSQNRKHLNTWMEQYRQQDKTHWKELYTIDAEGQLKPISQISWIQPKVSEAEYQAVEAPIYYKLINLPSPLLYSLIGYIPNYRDAITDYFNQGRYRPTLVSQLARMIAFRTPSLVYCIFLSFLSVSFVLWHGVSRQRSRIRLGAWVVLTALFNVAGLLTYLAFNHTATVRCVNCGKRRGIETDACPRCVAPLPQPIHSKPHLIMNRSQLSEALT